MGKKTKFNRDLNASINNRDFFGTIYVGMCKSPAYKRLSIGAKQFYTICRVQAQSPEGTACLYNHGQEYGKNYNKEIYFVFPARHLKQYGYDRANANRYLNILEKEGFIKKCECNKPIYKVNVYKFVDDWKSK